jgi:hypothetical protein
MNKYWWIKVSRTTLVYKEDESSVLWVAGGFNSNNKWRKSTAETFIEAKKVRIRLHNWDRWAEVPELFVLAKGCYV